MMSILNVLAGFSAAAAGSLVAAVWEGLVLVALVALSLRLLPEISAAARSVVWTAVLVLVVGLHFAPLVMQGGAVQGDGDLVHADLRWSFLLVGVWGILSAVRAVQLVRSALSLRGIVRRAVPVVPSPVDEAILRCGWRRAVVCVSADVDRPSVAGHFSPRILLPTDAMELMTQAELEQIVLHETEHLRRGDDWTNLMQKVGLMLFPLNPALLWVERRLCVERELACDDSVLRATGNGKGYAACLTHLAEGSMLRRGATLALGAWERQSELARRVYRILRRSDLSAAPRYTRAVSAVVLVGVVAGGAGLSRMPELVSFARVDGTPVAGMQHAGVRNGAIALAHAELMQSQRTARPMDVMMRLPQAVTKSATRVHRSRARETMPSGVRAENAAMMAQAESFLVSSVSDAEGAARVQLSVEQDATVGDIAPQVIQVSYAAIRVENGWIVFQL